MLLMTEHGLDQRKVTGKLENPFKQIKMNTEHIKADG
jgi:hypothetical protein